MEEIKVSIIVPIYNVEQYIEKCIESIIGQTLSEIEIILVDDGSSDRSGYLCDQYAKRDSRIKVIHKKNAGLVAARKTGLEYAGGEYIGYVDGDDFVEKDLFQKMYACMKNNDADMLAVGFTRDHGHEKEKVSNEVNSGIFQGKRRFDIYNKMVYSGEYFKPGIIPSVWSKLFKKELLLNAQTKVSDLIRMGEDVACTYPALLNANKIVVDNEIYGYHYRMVEHSMTRMIDENYFENALQLYLLLDECFNHNNQLLQQLDYYKIYLTDIQMKLIGSRKNRMTYKQKKKLTEQRYGNSQLYPQVKLCELPIGVRIQSYAIRHKIFGMLPFVIAFEKKMKA